MKILVLSIGAGLAALWLFIFVNLASQLWRRERRTESRLSLPPIRFVDWFRRELFWLIVGSLMMMINAIVFLIGSTWYRLRRKPIPPPPWARGRIPDNASGSP